MIRTGDVLDNHVTGERIVFHRTAADTGGEAIVIEAIVPAGTVAAPARIHPSQEKRFQVLHGQMGFEVGRRVQLIGPGGRLTIPRGERHRLWNAGDNDAQFVCEIRPALQFESLLESRYSLARDGKTNRLRLAVIAYAHFDTVRRASPPAALQKLALALGSALGRMLGYGAVYPRAA